MEKNEKRLYFSLCLAKNLSHSLPWLELVLLSHPWPKIEKERRKDALSAFLTLFFFPSKKIKEGIAKASPLLVSVKGTDDKIWRKD